MSPQKITCLEASLTSHSSVACSRTEGWQEQSVTVTSILTLFRPTIMMIHRVWPCCWASRPVAHQVLDLLRLLRNVKNPLRSKKSLTASSHKRVWQGPLRLPLKSETSSSKASSRARFHRKSSSLSKLTHSLTR